MRATIMYRAGDVRVENVPDAKIEKPTDALVRITRACICGSDLWPYHELEPSENGRRMGHEAIGVVEAVGAEVRKVKNGDFVVMPFAFSDGSCDFCHEGLQTSCVHGGFFGYTEGVGGAQAEAIRIPLADGTLYALPVRENHALVASLLTLSDVMGTGHHAAVVAKVSRGKKAAVVGDGAVGLCGVIAAKRLGAEQIILLGRHPARIALAKAFGATDIVSERGEEAVEGVRKLTGGFGVHSVLECVGTDQAMLTAVNITRPGGTVGRVGVPHYEATPSSQQAFYNNVTVGGGPAPVRAYIEAINLWDVNLHAGKAAELPLPDGHTTTFLVLSGEVTVNGEKAAGEGDFAIFACAGDGITVKANTDAKLLVMGGEPIDEPVVGHGPFVMNSRTEIQQAFEEYQLGKMGEIR